MFIPVLTSLNVVAEIREKLGGGGRALALRADITRDLPTIASYAFLAVSIHFVNSRHRPIPGPGSGRLFPEWELPVNRSWEI